MDTELDSGSFTFWNSLSPRPKAETKWLNFGQVVTGLTGDEINQLPQRVIADVIGHSSLMSPHFFVYF